MKIRELIHNMGNWLVLLMFFGFFEAFPQDLSGFYKFPITRSGVYKVQENQVINLGLSGLDQTAVFGNPGLLPQKLDSIGLTLREIPTLKIEDALYFYLEGPHRTIVSDHVLDYIHHHYTDTLYYLIGKKTDPKKIPLNPSENPGVSAGIYHQFHSVKPEETNLLNSGRKWYSNPIFNNQYRTIIFPKPTGSGSQTLFQARLIGQSLSEITFGIKAKEQSFETLNIAAIPNTTYGIKGREALVNQEIEISGSEAIPLEFSIQTANPNGAGYLDYALLGFTFSSSSLPSGIYHHFEPNPVAFSVLAGNRVFKVTDFYGVEEFAGNGLSDHGDLIAVFDPSEVGPISELQPADLSLRIENSGSSLLIVTVPELVSQANRLAEHKNRIGISTKVITLVEAYDAFGYGTRDLTALRNHFAFLFHGNKQIKHVLLFGKGTMDYKNKIGGRPNHVPTYSSENSLNPLTSYSSDDYFGLLEYGQGEWTESSSGDETLQIGIGRIPAINIREARTAVDKIIAYENRVNMEGDWKRTVTFFADDGDNNIHLNDAENHAAYLAKNHPEFRLEKLYLDRFEQLRSASGQSSSEAKEALTERIENGTLILNYIGHGNETTLTAERVFTVSDLNNWSENTFLPLIVTATCEFGRQDSPLIRSGAEEMLFAQNKGAIALLTTGRPVFSSVNFTLNKAFIEAVFKQENGEYKDLGSIFVLTKNNSLNGPFNRNFSLLGDPSMKLALPELATTVENVFDIHLETFTDTLKAMQEIQIKGQIIDPLTQARIPQAEGKYEIIISDKPGKIRTLGDESNPIDFLEENSILFIGSGEVMEGAFVSSVFIPKNIDYTTGTGKIRVFASLEGSDKEAMGARNIFIGGSSPVVPEDKEGPKIEMRFGGEEFKETVFTSTTIPFSAFLEDESGINISSSNIGQDIVLRINNNPPLILNKAFIALDGGYKRGKIETLLAGFNEGINRVSMEAWDNMGNRSEAVKEINIKGSLKIKILRQTAYPNPSSEKSRFRIQHNRAGENLLLELRVFTTSGHEIYSVSRRYVKADFILDNLEWNFLRNKTNYPVKGTYIYELKLVSETDGTSDRKGGKIVIQ